MKLTHGSLFSGIGGFDLAAEWAGFKNLFACEFDPFCQKVLAYHFPNSKIYGDIKETDFSEWRGKVDILTGGFPCQPFSHAGKREGTEDDRYLWPEMLRVIQEVRPAWVIGENVAGILSMVQPGREVKVGERADLFGEGHDVHKTEEPYVIESICRDLEQEGYSVQPFVIPACAVGAPHRRDRVWIVANSDGSRGGDTVRAEREGSQGLGQGGEGAEHREDGGNGASSHSGGAGLQTPRSEIATAGTAGTRLEQTVTNTTSERAGALHGSRDEGEWWHDFPTQSPVRGRDDEFSSRLDGITFPAWRRESLKAYGNAIVPQVAYEIFRAIKQTCKTEL